MALALYGMLLLFIVLRLLLRVQRLGGAREEAPAPLAAFEVAGRRRAVLLSILSLVVLLMCV